MGQRRGTSDVAAPEPNITEDRLDLTVHETN